MTTFLPDGSGHRRSVSRAGVWNNHDESDYEGKRASCMVCFIHKLQKHFMKDMGSGNRKYKENRRNIYGKTVWLKIATRFSIQKGKRLKYSGFSDIYRSSRLISRGRFHMFQCNLIDVGSIAILHTIQKLPYVLRKSVPYGLYVQGRVQPAVSCGT